MLLWHHLRKSRVKTNVILQASKALSCLVRCKGNPQGCPAGLVIIRWEMGSKMFANILCFQLLFPSMPRALVIEKSQVKQHGELLTTWEWVCGCRMFSKKVNMKQSSWPLPTDELLELVTVLLFLFLFCWVKRQRSRNFILNLISNILLKTLNYMKITLHMT